MIPHETLKHFLVAQILAFIFACRFSEAALNATDGIVYYSTIEEKPVGTTVGNFASDAGLSRTLTLEDLQKVNFTITSSDPSIADYFSIDYGILKIKRVINREVICPQQAACEMNLNVILQPKEYFQLIKVTVTVEDINDYAPTFSPSRMNITIPESSPLGEIFAFPAAIDLDSPPNGVAYYALQPDRDPFRLQVYNFSGMLDPRLNLTSLLDREQQSFYTLTLVAYDGGAPTLSGSMLLEIFVGDVNDNSPVFDNASYEIVVPETTTVNTVLITVHATDQDTGPNGRIQYSFSQRSQSQFSRIFSIESDTGRVILLQTLDAADRSSYNLSIIATDQGPNGGLTGSAGLRIVVQPVLSRPPVITVYVPSDDGIVAKIADSSPAGTFVASVSVDSQGSQPTSCSLNDTRSFQLVPVAVNNFKIVTTKIFNVADQNSYAVTVTCSVDANPNLAAAKTLQVTVTPVSVKPPVFVNSTYTSTVSAYSPLNTIVVTVRAESPSTNTRNLTIAYGNSSDVRFVVDTRTGVVTTQVSFRKEDIGAIVEFSVLAYYKELGNGPSSRALVRVTVVDGGVKPPRFQQNYYSFSVIETSDVGTSVGSVVATTPAGDSVSYAMTAPQQEASTSDLRVDPITGVVYTTRLLNHDVSPQYGFLIVARSVKFPDLNDTAQVDVYIQTNRPVIGFPIPGNNTVSVVSDAPVGTVVASVTATLQQPGHPLCFSVWNNISSDLFSIDSKTGELRLKYNVSQFLNHTLALTIDVSVCGYPFARSSAFLYVSIVQNPNSLPGSPMGRGSDSKVVILASVLAICLVLASLMIIAIVIVCRRSRRRKANGTAAPLWTLGPLQQNSNARSSTPDSSRSPPLVPRNGSRSSPADINLDLSTAPFKLMTPEDPDADSGYPSNSSSSQTSSDDGGGGGGAGGGGGIQTPVSSPPAEPPGRRGSTQGTSSHPSANHDGGQAVFTTTSSSMPYATSVSTWLRSSANSLSSNSELRRHSLGGATKPPDPQQPIVLKPSLSRSGSQASRRSTRSTGEGSEAKKRVTFAEEDQYVELSSADVTASDVADLSDVTASPGGDADDDVSSEASYSDSTSRRTFINTLANTYAPTAQYPPPGVTFGNFRPEDGSLV